MSDMLSISSTAVMAYQRALGTVSNNIANVGTEGYSRQDITLNANTPSKQGTVYIGNGVVFDGVKRQVNDFVESNLRNSQSDLATQEPMLSYANRVVDIMGSESTGLTTALNQFFAGAQALSADPASTILRANFMSDADSLTARFRELSGQLSSLQDETAQAVDAKVGELNTLAKQLALVNKQLAKNLTAAKQPPELMDQRDLILKQMSQFASIKTSFTTNGTVSVSLGQTISQGKLVDGQQVNPLTVAFSPTSPDKVDLAVRLTDGSLQTLSSISSGEIGGLLAFREQVLSPARSSLDVLATTFANEVNAVHTQSLDGYGNPGQAMFGFDTVAGDTYVTGGMRVLLDDPQKIAAAAQFRVIEEPNNASTVRATLAYQAPVPSTTPADISTNLVNNPSPSAGVAVTLSATQPFAMLTSVAAGTQSAVVYLDELQAGQAVQVMTREGVHVLGDELTLDEQNMMLRDTYGFNAQAKYSTDYLNVEGEAAYRKSDLFLGAKAEPLLAQVFDDAGLPMDGQPLEALLQSGRISAQLGEAGIAADALTLNGVSLGALVPAGDTVQASEVATWLNSAGVPGLTAAATNEVRVASASLNLSRTLELQGDGATVATITPPTGGFADAAALVEAINAQSVVTQVSASVSKDGEVVLTNVAGSEGKHITVGPAQLGGQPDNALGIAAQTFAGSLTLSRSLDDPLDQDIRVGIGATGSAQDLKALGLRTAVYVADESQDEYLVMVTGAGSLSASASYTASTQDATQALRAQPFDITLTATNEYTITDRNTGTIVATRAFDPNALPPSISYQGITLTFTSPPAVGDQFGVDGNQDGVGNNEGMLRIVGLASDKVMPGDKTFAEAYIEQVSQVGNMSQQARVAKDALTVVYDQALETRDGISGVSLDEEAANLIRFQQAYQASAKVMQTASTLFDAILAVR